MWILVGFLACVGICIAFAVVHRRQLARQRQLAQDLMLAISSGDAAGVESIYVGYAHELSSQQREATRRWLDEHPQSSALPPAKDW
jgi:hypothetical protein